MSDIAGGLDYARQHEKIKDAIVKGIGDQFPIQGSKKRLVLNDLWVQDKNRHPQDIPAQREVKINGRSWTIPAYADVSLVDNVTGRELDRTKKVKIADIPSLTNRFSVIVDGNEFQTTNQFRLKTGIYTRVKDNGQLESQFNLDPGFNFKMTLDPESEVFYLNAGNRKYRLYNVLRWVFNLTDVDIATKWGKQIYDANVKGASGNHESEIIDLYEKVAHEKVAFDAARSGLAAYFAKTGVSPETTKITLGSPFSTVSGDALLATSSKLLNVMRGKDEPDERDSLIFKDLYTVDDLLEQFFLKRGKELKRGLAYRVDVKDRVRDVIGSKTYGGPIKEFFGKSDLVSPPPQTNPVNILDEWRKTTITGTGGVTSRHAITMDVRNVHPSAFGFLDPVNTPESGKVGVSLGLSIDADKLDKGLSTSIITTAGDRKKVTPLELHEMYVGFPDEYEMINGKPKAKNAKVRAMYKGKADIYPADKVKAFIPYGSSMFTASTNLIPFLAHNQGNRAMMGSRMMGQALAIEGRQAPNVRVRLQKEKGTDASFEDAFGNYLNPVSTEDGTVTKMTDDYIYVKHKKDPTKVTKWGLYKNFPLNQEVFLHSTPRVRVGEDVKKGQVLADNNYNSDGHLALGRNVNVAYMPWHGYNFEDAAVVTESFAEQFSHDNIIKKTKIIADKGELNLKKFRAYFPEIIDKANADLLDDEGVIKPGSAIKPDQILVAYMQEKEANADEQALKNLHRTIAVPYAPSPVKWDYDHPGVVTDVKRFNKKVVVYIKVRHPLVVGDKIAGKHGNKSIVAKIIKDEEAPHTKDGERIDLMLNPHGVPGRINVGQILETAAGKLVEKTGKPYVVENFDGTDHMEVLKEEYAKNGLEFDEVLTDGKNGKEFKNPIFTGNQYIMKLHHTVEHKLKARDAGPTAGGYDYNEQPSRGERGGQSLDAMMMYALLAHGAKKNLYEMGSIKGQKNDEFWRALQLGLPLPPPQKNFVFDKMEALLKGAGVNTTKKGNFMKLLPLTDKEVEEMSSGALNLEQGKAAHIFRGKDLKPIAGGLFDEKATGGYKGRKWAHFELPIKIPNPMYESAIIKVLDITGPKFNQILKSEGGAQQLEMMLTNVGKDLDGAIANAKKELAAAPDGKVNTINKRIKYLVALKAAGLKPQDAYMMKKVPILPPIYRPIYPLPSGDLMTSPINKHYKDVALIGDGLQREMKIGYKPGIQKGTVRMYDAVKAMQGFIDPVTYTKEKYEGILQTLSGDSPKHGFIQNRVWSKKQDVSARSTITLEPSLGIDEVGLPEAVAKVIYKPFVIKKLIDMGGTAMEAVKEYKDWSPRADRALEAVMEDRPVMLNRAPTLHKHGVQAFKPVKVKGKSIKLNPLIVSGFNADFDGDTMSVHVPIMPKAVEEAKNMLPSKIVFKAGDNAVVPEIAMEYMLGLYYLTKEGKDTKKTYATLKEARDAGLSDQDLFELKGVGKTSLGKATLNAVLPKPLRDYSMVLNKSKLKKILERVAKEHPKEFAEVMNKLRDLGNQYSHEWGASISLTDMDIDRSYRDKIVLETSKKVKNAKSEEERVQLWAKAKQDIKNKMAEKLRATNNRIQDMLDSGSAKKEEQATQMIMFPGMFEDIKGKALPAPFVKSYAEGFNTFDYWNGMYGVRKGAINTAVNTQETGYLNKQLLGVNKKLTIIEDDCETLKGIEIGIDEKDVMDRYMAKAIAGVGDRDTIVDMGVVAKAKAKRLTKLTVRSPLTCESLNGICVKCYGLLPNGELPEVGENVGILESQAMTERATQLTLQTRHTGGAAGVQNVAGSFPRLRQLFDLPKTIPNQATVSKASGTVKNVIKTPVGGYEIYVRTTGNDSEKFSIAPGLKPTVSKGDEVTAGQLISTGSARPQDISEAQGHLAAQKYIVDEMDKVYGGNYFKKTFETVVRGTSNNAVVTEAPDDADYLRGDIATITGLERENKRRSEGGLDTIKYDPKFISIGSLPTVDEDWLSRLTTRYLKQTIQEGAAQGMVSNLQGSDPIPGYMYGKEK